MIRTLRRVVMGVSVAGVSMVAVTGTSYASAAHPASGGARAASQAQPAPAGTTRVLREFRRYGYLVADRAALERAKASSMPLTGAMPRSGALDGDGLEFPQATGRIGWNGVSGVNSQLIPSDSTGAIGLTRYVELTNGDYAIYTHAQRRIAQGSLRSLAGLPSGPNDQAVDPQIIWDPTSRRFYYVVLDPNGVQFTQ